MDIESAKTFIMATHVAALQRGERPSSRHMRSGPGIGKSESMFQLSADAAKYLNEPVGLVVEMLASYMSVDVRGFMLPQRAADGLLDTVWSRPSWFPAKANLWVVTPGGTWHKPGTWTGAIPTVGYLFLDELSQAEEDVQKAAAELILNGRVGTTELPIGWQVVSAGNRTSDRSGVMRELMHVINRRCLLNIEPSLPAWLAWADRQPEKTRLHYLTVAFASKNSSIVFQDRVPDGSDPYCTPRSLCRMDRDLQDLRSSEDIAHGRLPMNGLVSEVASGWIGGAASAHYFQFVKHAEVLPDFADIEANPMTAKLPPGHDAQMIVGYFLYEHANEDNAGQVFRYLARMTVEMQIMVVGLINKNDQRRRAFAALPEFNQFVMRNREVILASGG